jgi:hypothetical protein
VKNLPSSSTADLLQIPITLLHTFKKGSITLQTDATENIEVQVEDNKMDLNFSQKQQLKTLLQLQAETKESLRQKLKDLKTLAEELRQNNLTITISYRDQKLLTLGQEAKPTFSQLITETTAIEVNNLIELIKLAE